MRYRKNAAAAINLVIVLMLRRVLPHDRLHVCGRKCAAGAGQHFIFLDVSLRERGFQPSHLPKACIRYLSKAFQQRFRMKALSSRLALGTASVIRKYRFRIISAMCRRQRPACLGRSWQWDDELARERKVLAPPMSVSYTCTDSCRRGRAAMAQRP
eukprot:scaffold48_cov311-Pinguiococcus_pyrenoidosus.AAC.158